jgi:hypothetical protein
VWRHVALAVRNDVEYLAVAQVERVLGQQRRRRRVTALRNRTIARARRAVTRRTRSPELFGSAGNGVWVFD